uniref:Retrograde Golgi transport protein RGP1 homolog [Megachile rotundata] n=1 Tax=Lepeophtheirus salmonis TaxID=72036 RepID=A0A0K2T7G6_LEPSM
MEISVVLLDRNVFAFGETIRSQITFSNTSASKVESLGWASVQIHCSCTLSDVSSSDEVTLSQNRLITSFQPVLESGSKDVYASKPSILFADMILDPGTSKVFMYEEQIPQNSNQFPPSYLGQGIKYSYKLIVGTQRVNSNIKMIKIPFRVIKSIAPQNMSCFEESRDPDDKALDTNGNLSKSPFITLSDECKEDGDCHSFNHSEIYYGGSSKSFHHYEIANKVGKLAKLSLFKNSFRIGEEVIGSFQFYNQDIRCVEYSVSLISEETLNNSNLELGDLKKGLNISCVAKCHDVTLGYQFSNMALQIPLHVTPTFQTIQCQLNWYLHFVFVITPKITYQNNVGQSEDDEWNGPKTLEVETMVWDLPITLCPTSPDVLTNSLLQPFSKRSVVCEI